MNINELKFYLLFRQGGHRIKKKNPKFKMFFRTDNDQPILNPKTELICHLNETFQVFIPKIDID